MHISEGVLNAPALAAGAAGAAALLAIGLKRLPEEKIPETAILSSVFFVASLIHVPIGPASGHLLLNGLIGLLLGWAAFPAIFVALALQAVLFQFGGLTTLGVNSVCMGLPALVVAAVFGGMVRRTGRSGIAAAAAAGAAAVLLSALLMAGFLIIGDNRQTLGELAGAIIVLHLPLAAIEGAATAAVIGFLRQASPEMLHNVPAAE